MEFRFIFYSNLMDKQYYEFPIKRSRPRKPSYMWNSRKREKERDASILVNMTHRESQVRVNWITSRPQWLWPMDFIDTVPIMIYDESDKNTLAALNKNYWHSF